MNAEKIIQDIIKTSDILSSKTHMFTMTDDFELKGDLNAVQDELSDFHPDFDRNTPEIKIQIKIPDKRWIDSKDQPDTIGELLTDNLKKKNYKYESEHSHTFLNYKVITKNFKVTPATKSIEFITTLDNI